MLARQKQISRQPQLGKENDRHPDGESAVLCLMPEGIHAQKHPGAAAQERHSKEGGLGNPPAVPAGFFFVDPHKQQTQRID